MMLTSQQNIYARSYGTIIADLQSPSRVVVIDLRATIGAYADLIIGVPFIFRHEVWLPIGQDFMVETAKQPFQHNSTPIFPTVSPVWQAAPDYSKPPGRPFSRRRCGLPRSRN